MLTCTKDTHFFRFGGSCQCRELAARNALVDVTEPSEHPKTETPGKLWFFPKDFEVGDRVRWLTDGLPSPVAGTVIETYKPGYGPWWCARVHLDNGLIGSYFQAHLIPAEEAE